MTLCCLLIATDIEGAFTAISHFIDEKKKEVEGWFKQLSEFSGLQEKHAIRPEEMLTIIHRSCCSSKKKDADHHPPVLLLVTKAPLRPFF